MGNKKASNAAEAFDQAMADGAVPAHLAELDRELAELDPEMAKELEGMDTLSDGSAEPSQEGEWVTFAEGVTIFGHLKRAFFVTGQGEPRPAYAVADAKDPSKVWVFGEKAGLKPIRDMRIGDKVFIKCVGQDELGTNRTIWRFIVKGQAKPGTGKKVLDVLVREHKSLAAVPF